MKNKLDKIDIDSIIPVIDFKCPNCLNGFLARLNEKEIEKLKVENGKDNYPKNIFGCDECKYWVDEKELLRNNTVSNVVFIE